MRNKGSRKSYGGRKYWREGQEVTVNMVSALVPCSKAAAQARIYKFDTIAEIFAPLQGKNIEFTLNDGRKVNTKDVVAANPKISMALALIRLKTLNVWKDIIRDPEQQGGDSRISPKGVPASIEPVKSRTMQFGLDPLTVLAKPVKIDEDEE